MLPPGQIARADFPRFGLTQYAERYPSQPTDCAVSVKMLSAAPVVLNDALSGLARTTLQADFHCVTTWSRIGLVWGGVRFSDFFSQRIAPLSVASATIAGVGSGRKFRSLSSSCEKRGVCGTMPASCVQASMSDYWAYLHQSRVANHITSGCRAIGLS